jgi:tetratricopeptide (TPR) repeat protein/transcriptional regulator with XRE-family HTH domain
VRQDKPPSANHHLIHARQRKCWSQETVAGKLGTTRVTISRWEHGIRFPSPYYRQQLCTVFDCTPEALGLLPGGSSDRPAYHDRDTGGLDASWLVHAGLARTVPEELVDVSVLPPPPPNHGLIGRDDLLQHLKQRLCAGTSTALSALNGLPGVGKTALAATLAHDQEVLARFPDGVLWAGLGVKPNVLGLLGAWGTALGLTATSLAPLTNLEVLATVLRAAIGRRRVLLVIDDAWALEDALGFKVGGPGCAHLVTTRFPDLALHMAGEGAFVVQELSEDEGLTLLGRYAPEVVSRERESARALVQLAGGLPLALTLMGSYLQVQAYTRQPRRVQAALEQLHQVDARLRLAEPCASVDRPPSLPSTTPLSLCAAIEVSDQRLDPAARAGLRALTVFPAKPNTFTEAAAQAVCAAPPDVLDALTDAGLLESGGWGRYTLHQTVADYARLDVTDTATAAARTHLATFFVAYVEAHETDYQALEREMPNILSALDAAFEHEMLSTVVRSANAFAGFLLTRGLCELADVHLRRALHAALATGDDAGCARTCLHLGRISELHGELGGAAKLYEKGIAAARTVDDRPTLIALLTHWGEVALHQGDYVEAERRVHEGIALVHQTGDRQAESVLLRLLGEVTDCQGNFVRATGLYQEGLALARAAGDRESMSALLQNLGYKAIKRRDDQLAGQLFQEGLVHARALGHRQRISALLNNLGALAYRGRRYDEAEGLYQESLDLARMVGHRLRMSLALQSLGVLERERDECARAEAFLNESLDLARQVGDPALISETLTECGKLYLRLHQIEAASDTFREALSRAREVRIGFYIAGALHGLAQVAAAQGHVATARRLGEASLQHCDAEDQERAEEVTQWLVGLPAYRPIGQAVKT